MVFLGHLISKEGIYVDLRKVEAVLKWEQSTNITAIQSFLGSVRYYQRFIERFSKIASPMTQLTRKRVKFDWTREREGSSQEL
jgi:hypothetical protein